MSRDKGDKEWFELPRPAAVGRLVEIRNELRATNLYDTEDPPLRRARPRFLLRPRSDVRPAASSTIACPMMGSTGARFGRNVPLSETFPDTANLMHPNPRTISQELFTRRRVSAGHDPQRDGGGLDPVPDT